MEEDDGGDPGEEEEEREGDGHDEGLEDEGQHSGPAPGLGERSVRGQRPGHRSGGGGERASVIDSSHGVPPMSPEDEEALSIAVSGFGIILECGITW